MTQTGNAVNDVVLVNDNANAVTQLKFDLDQAIKDLIEVAGETLSASFDLDDYVTDFSVPEWRIWDSVTQPSAINFADTAIIPDDLKPALPEFTFNPEDYINSDLLTRYSYDSDFFDNFLDSRLRTYIDSQAYFLAQEVQDALFQASRERDLQTLNDAIDAVDRQFARKGFPAPTSLFMAARNEVIKKYQDTYADRNKEITTLIADKSLQEKMHAMDTSIKMEDIRSRFQLEYGKLYWQAAMYLIEKYKVDVEAELSKVGSNLNVLKTNLEVDKINVDRLLKEAELENSQQEARLRAEMEELVQQISLWKEQYLARIKAAEETVNYYKSQVLGTLGQINYIKNTSSSA